ncbi:MAG: hypothetical protein LBD17_05150 [Endomicrobium sp.]|jgi:hypothetical protein|nr:hypothetical protein [Endomicrobium sp.]
MKRIVFALLVMLMLVAFSADNFGELNFKTGLHFAGKIDIKTNDKSIMADHVSRYSNTGIAFTGEYLLPCEYFCKTLNNFKIGAGFSYIFPEKLLKKEVGIVSLFFSCAPIYFTVQANPLKKLSGLFVKGNVGYNALFDITASILGREVKDSNKGGVYYGFSSGYEFSKGFIVDLGYNIYKGVEKVVVDTTENEIEIDYTHSGVTFNCGYKF